MIRLYECLRHEHDWLLVSLAALICLASSFAASVILDRLKKRTGSARSVWLFTIAAVVGFGIWATHFVAMLAYEPGVGFSFDFLKTLLSLVLIVGISLPAFEFISGSRNRIKNLLGATMFGFGISAMHYSGMRGLMPDGFMVWNKSYVLVSVIMGCVFSIIAFEMHKRHKKLKGQIVCALFMTLAICSMHFVGMSALTLVPYGIGEPTEYGLSPGVLGVFIGAAAIIVLQTGIAAAVFDSWMWQRKRSEKWKAREHETLLASMAEVAKIGAWELDLETMTPIWSAQTRALHKVDNAFRPDLEIAASFFPGDAGKTFLDTIDAACRGKKGFDIELPFRTDMGEALWVRVVCRFLTQDGHQCKLIGAYQDITHHKVERDSIEEARDVADKANKLKSEFLANMSHEIRTPLNGVLGMAQLLEKTELDDKQRKFTDTIFSSGTSLLTLINDILDISKIEAGLLELETEPFDLNTVLTDVQSAIAGIALQKGIEVSSKCEPGVEGLYCGDAQRIKQVLINLVGNGLKFTEEGSVNIRVRSTDSSELRFEVTDTGPGIAPEKLKAVFERFTQEDGSITRKHGGTGLGLAISRDLVELMGGQIGVESAAGKGAQFWFQIPLETVDATLQQKAQTLGETHASVTLFDDFEEPANIQEADAPADQHQECKILLAEDNPVNQVMIAESLKLMDGISLSTVENGAEAIAHLDRYDCDLVLMDGNMPVLSGDEAIIRIRASSEPYADIPIFVLSANALAGDEADYLKAGATAYLSKPINIDQLMDAVRGYMKPSSEPAVSIAKVS